MTGRCATPGCTLPAQPGREKCASCIRAGIAERTVIGKAFEAKLTDLDPPGANKSPALPRSNIVQRMKGQGIDGFKGRRR